MGAWKWANLCGHHQKSFALSALSVKPNYCIFIETFPVKKRKII
jgi:hypothetical protein